MNNTNISELIEKSSYRRAPEKVIFSRKNLNDLTILECSHDGYLKNFGIIVKRILKIYKNHDEISGQDSILSIKSNFFTVLFAISAIAQTLCQVISKTPKLIAF